MKKFNTSLILAMALSAATLSLTAPANATSSQRFESTLSAPSTTVSVNISISEDLAYRADHMSKKLHDRSKARNLNNGFAGRGFYGEKDLNRLEERLERKITEQLAKNGIEVSDNAPTVLNLVITDADPNRPTFKQLSKNPSQSYRSFGLGGAEFAGTMTSAGQEVGTVSYAWYESDIRDASYGSTWSDANRAIDRFAKKTAKALAGD
jgi:hypothetical protein